MKKKQKNQLLKICVIAMLSAIAFVLMLYEFPTTFIPAAAHLKMDFSDIPALLGAIVFGPLTGVVIELIKNLLELIVKGLGTQMGFGNIMNFIVGCAFVVPFTLTYNSLKKKLGENKSIVIGSIVGVLAIIVIGIGANYFVTPLFYKHFLGITFDSATLWTAIWAASAVNAIKGIMLGVISVPIIKVLIKRINKII